MDKLSLDLIKDEVKRHPIFLKNCKAQRKRNAKICLDCPFIKLGILEPQKGLTTAP